MQIAPETSAMPGSEEEANSSRKKKKSSSKSESADLEEGEQGAEEGGELEEEASMRTITRRFMKWTSEDLFDWNPEYAKTARGVLTLLHTVLSALVMTMVGSGCAVGSFFYCHSSATFMFVIASSAMIQSTLMLVCCLLSKKGDAIIHATVLELLYYAVYSLLFLLAGLALESNLAPKEGGYRIIMAGGVFGITNSILYLISAVWCFLFFKANFDDRDASRDGKRQRRESD